MKNKVLFAGLYAIALAAFTSCETNGQPDKDPGENNGGEAATPVLTVTPETIVLNAESADKTAMTLSWSETENKYDLYINLASKDIFTAPYKAGDLTGYSKVFTHAELNDIVIGLGAEPGTATDIQAMLYSENDQSEKAIVQVTPYKKPFEAPVSLYIAGYATPYGWKLTDSPAVPASKNDPNVFEIKGLPMTVVVPGSTIGFKLYFSNDSSDPRVATQDPSSDVFGTIKVYDEDTSSEFVPANHGYTNGMYDIKADFNDMKVTITRTGDLPKTELPDKLYMLGDCFTWSWNWNGTTLDKVSDGVYKAKNVSMDFGGEHGNGFKIFTGIEKWAPYYAMSTESTKDNIIIIETEGGEGDPQVRPGTIGYENGLYDIEADFNQMTMKLILLEDPYADVMWMHGNAISDEWAQNEVIIPKKNDSEWEVSHIYLTLTEDWRSIFVFKHYNEWWPYYGQLDTDTEFGIMHEVLDQNQKTAEGEPSFKPHKFGYESGYYTININTKTMRLTLTKEE